VHTRCRLWIRVCVGYCPNIDRYPDPIIPCLSIGLYCTIPLYHFELFTDIASYKIYFTKLWNCKSNFHETTCPTFSVILYSLYCKQIKREFRFFKSKGFITIIVNKFITFTVLWLLQLRLEYVLHLQLNFITFTVTCSCITFTNVSLDSYASHTIVK